jgi:hypothetical protein
MARLPPVELEVHASFALVRPGDTLIVGTSRLLTVQEHSDWKARLEADLPGVKIVLTEASGLAVYRG